MFGRCCQTRRKSRAEERGRTCLRLRAGRCPNAHDKKHGAKPGPAGWSLAHGLSHLLSTAPRGSADEEQNRHARPQAQRTDVRISQHRGRRNLRYVVGRRSTGKALLTPNNGPGLRASAWRRRQAGARQDLSRTGASAGELRATYFARSTPRNWPSRGRCRTCTGVLSHWSLPASVSPACAVGGVQPDDRRNKAAVTHTVIDRQRRHAVLGRHWLTMEVNSHGLTLHLIIIRWCRESRCRRRLARLAGDGAAA